MFNEDKDTTWSANFLEKSQHDLTAWERSWVMEWSYYNKGILDLGCLQLVVIYWVLQATRMFFHLQIDPSNKTIEPGRCGPSNSHLRRHAVDVGFIMN